MDLGVTPKVTPLIEAVREMVQTDIAPLDAEYHAEVGRHPSGDRFALTMAAEIFGTAAIFWVLIPIGLAGGALLLKLQGDD